MEISVAINKTTDQVVRFFSGVHLISTESDSISLSLEDERFKTSIFSTAGGGTFLLECEEQICLVFPSSATYSRQRIGEAHGFDFKKIK